MSIIAIDMCMSLSGRFVLIAVDLGAGLVVVDKFLEVVEFLVLDDASVPVISVVEQGLLGRRLEPRAARDVTRNEAAEDSKAKRQEGASKLEACLGLGATTVLGEP